MLAGRRPYKKVKDIIHITGMPQEAVSAEGILSYIDKNGPFNSEDYANSIQEDHQKVVGIIKSLQGLGQVVNVEQVTRKHWELTDEGRDVARTGSHEAKVFNAVPPEGIAQSELMSSVPNAKIGFSKAVSCGWVRVDKGPAGARVCRRVQSVTDVVRLHLAALQDSADADVSEKLKAEYKKRKLLQEVVSKSYTVSKGADFTLNIEKPETDLTPEMIASGSWRSKTFKPYNFSALGVPPARGHLHPLLKVRAEFRQIFLEMGFSEMPTNRYVESSFWNFDALFQPQQHPARDAHDTFFISDPANSVSLPADYLPKVKRVHSQGGFGSQGYGYDWKLEEAQKNLLRTHTTAVSARMLRQLAQEKEFRPVKYFSIDRVFRNETLDATHLAEFHQVEGLVADRGLTLGHLMGVINEFFKKLGIEQIRFKPAYNPYTEPSMEIFSWHAGLGKWVEIGNSGVFRPEMLLPMGLPEDVNVIAWGLSLERPTMIKYKLDNIRDLCGHRVDLQMVASNPICRLDK
ncbi:Phenylalanine--tRNA ligase alpha subunit [Amphibalanus amphitrite]|uniref:phenylalanine--tRNA ligase n=1 Tax=Amphibalanus amphitrite TaxID=1232801 RepID=A0A6A4XDV8_AMPAM|nr:Phenylalanine--tRNA ligase alpha subunit [Amphibalanus amphitrite]